MSEKSKWGIPFIASFLDHSFTIRLTLGILVILCLSCFFYLHNIRFDIPSLNTISKKEILAPIDFEFLDESEINQRRQEVIQHLGKIYKIDPKTFNQQRIQYENYLSRYQSEDTAIHGAKFEEISNTLDRLEKVLTTTYYTDAHTLQKRKELNLSNESYLLFIPETTTTPLPFPSNVYDTLIEDAFSNVQLSPIQKLIINDIRQYKWLFQEDLITEIEVRSIAQATIPDIYQKVTAGTTILEKGEKISPYHIALLSALKSTFQERRFKYWDFKNLGASFLIAFVMTTIVITYIKNFYPIIFNSNKQISLIATIVILTLVIAKLVEYLAFHNSDYVEDFLQYPLITPFSAMLFCILINSHIAWLISGLLSIALCIGLSFRQEDFLILNLLGSVSAVLNTTNLHRRKDVFVVAIKGWLTCSMFIIAACLANQSALSVIYPPLISTFIFFLASSIILIGILPIFESVFCIVTDLSLMEYMDTSSPLLRRLSIEAPGTYQHTLAVANLAESAALAIQANGLFCRVAALYHDIGKITNPAYFIENQQSEINMHQLLTPLESAQVIIKHVADGVMLARKMGLPEAFIDIIQEHHGTTSARYFYLKQCKLTGNDQVDEQLFRYNGPKPRSKESAIIMIVDCIEAASRSLDECTESNLRTLIEKIIANKIQSAQFDQCALTFEEIAIIKDSIISTLLASAHMRIKYPSNAM
jgi:putative nucleotidyltransferase with HDIG domain